MEPPEMFKVKGDRAQWEDKAPMMPQGGEPAEQIRLPASGQFW